MPGAAMKKRKFRLVTAREPNGRIQRESLTSPGEVRRLRDAALKGLRDSYWGTELGRLYLVGKITASMFAAGKQWAEYAAKYSHALCSPSPDPKAVSWDRQGRETMDPDSHEGRREMRRHIRAVQSFTDAHVALKASGTHPERFVRSVCERNEMLPGYDGLLALACGLNSLSAFWGLTEQRKSMSDRHIPEIAAMPRIPPRLRPAGS